MMIGFTPDADYPVIFSEKGMAEFSIEKKLKPESGMPQLLSAKAGTAVNLVPDHAAAEIEQQDGSIKTLDFKGVSAHASTPEEGDNAITKLMAELGSCQLPEDLQSFDCRYPVGEEIEKRFKAIEDKARQSGLEMGEARNTPPLYIPKDSDLVKTMQEVYRQPDQSAEKSVYEYTRLRVLFLHQ